MFTSLEPSLRKRVAFVMNMGANGLGVVRSLGQLGIPVVGLDHVRDAPGFHSRYVRKSLCPDPVTEPDRLLDHLEREASVLAEKGILLPSSDGFVQFISRNRRELCKNFELIVAPEEVIDGLIDKHIQYGWAKKIGTPIPQTYFPEDMDDVRRISNEVTFPTFIKPLKSHLWTRRFGNKGFVINSPYELETRFAEVIESGLPAMIQKIIMPAGENIYGMGAYLGRDGYVSQPFTWKKIRQDPPNFGVGSCVISELLPQIAEMGLRFAKGIGFQGCFSIAFKLDPDDGQLKLMEMNGRIWMQNYHATFCGLNLPLLQYLDAQGAELPTTRGFEGGVVWWDALADFKTYIRLRRKGRSNLSEWIRSWFVPDVHAYYAPGDIMPALAHFKYGLQWAMVVGDLFRMKEDEDARW